MRATVEDCVIRIDDPGGQAENDGQPDLARTLRWFCRFGVTRFTLLSAVSINMDGLDRRLPKPVRITVQPPAGAALPDRHLLSDPCPRLPVNLGPLLQQAAGNRSAREHRVVLRQGSRALRGGISLIQPGDGISPPTDVLCEPAPRPGPERALFLDRDGVLNVDHGYVGRREAFEWIDGALAAIRAAADAGWMVFVVTNQSGVARGLYSEQDVRDLLDWMADEARAAGGTIDDARYCPYHPEAKVPPYRQAHPWRKPAPGMLLDLLRAWALDPEQAVMVGDQQTDMEAAAAAGVHSYLFTGGNLLDFLRPVLAASR
jgi:D,D-heptose 1,7-bisphosphate phosphatase